MKEEKSLFSYVTRFEDRDKAPVNNQWRSKKWGAIVVKKEESDYLARLPIMPVLSRLPNGRRN